MTVLPADSQVHAPCTLIPVFGDSIQMPTEVCADQKSIEYPTVLMQAFLPCPAQCPYSGMPWMFLECPAVQQGYTDRNATLEGVAHPTALPVMFAPAQTSQHQACPLPAPDSSVELCSLMDSMEESNAMIAQLDACDGAERTEIIEWLRPMTMQLALSPCGCRVMQKALDLGGRGLVDQLHGNVICLLESMHGNHVLQKVIEVNPPQSLQFVLDELALYPGGWASIAQHRFGCRVMERILEHCPEEMIAPLITSVILDVHVLCQHPYGNYVVQHVLEYGSAAHRTQVARILLARSGSLVPLGCSRYGSFTVKRLLEVLTGPVRTELVQQLGSSIVLLKASRHGRFLAKHLAAPAGGA